MVHYDFIFYHTKFNTFLILCEIRNFQSIQNEPGKRFDKNVCVFVYHIWPSWTFLDYSVSRLGYNLASTDLNFFSSVFSPRSLRDFYQMNSFGFNQIYHIMRSGPSNPATIETLFLRECMKKEKMRKCVNWLLNVKIKKSARLRYCVPPAGGHYNF